MINLIISDYNSDDEHEQENIKHILNENKDKKNEPNKELGQWIENAGSGDEDEYNAFQLAKKEFMKKQLNNINSTTNNVQQTEEQKGNISEPDTTSDNSKYKSISIRLL